MKKLAKGFTLIELMIVVAIIGILAAIAIPNFIKYQLRSKFSEASSNIEGLRKAEEALRQGERRLVVAGVLEPDYSPGQYWNLRAALLPSVFGGTGKSIWTPGELDIANGADWQVEGATYFQYEISTAGVPGSPAAANAGVAYTIGARSDIDGDTVNGEVALAKPAMNAATATDPTVISIGFPGVAADGSSCINDAGVTMYGTPCAITHSDIF